MQEGKEVPCCVNEPYILYDVPFFYQSLIHQSPFLTLYGTNDARTHARTHAGCTSDGDCNKTLWANTRSQMKSRRAALTSSFLYLYIFKQIMWFRFTVNLQQGTQHLSEYWADVACTTVHSVGGWFRLGARITKVSSRLLRYQ